MNIRYLANIGKCSSFDECDLVRPEEMDDLCGEFTLRYDTPEDTRVAIRLGMDRDECRNEFIEYLNQNEPIKNKPRKLNLWYPIYKGEKCNE